jgi:hypothetical protein
MGARGWAGPDRAWATPSADRTSPVAISPDRLAPQPDRLMREPKYTQNQWHATFQHHHSNMRRRAPRKRQKSAIPAQPGRNPRARPIGPPRRRSSAPRSTAQRKRRKFRAPPLHHSAGQHLAHSAVISTCQNIPDAGPIRPDPAAEIGRLRVQPWRNRNATNKHMIFICNVCGCRVATSRVHVRACVRSRTHARA